MTTRVVLGLSVLLGVFSGCAVIEPYADYTGTSAMPRPLEATVSLYRAGKPEPPIQNLGLVHVTCPWRRSGGEVQGGCSYAQAIEMVRRHCLMAGGDGLYDIKAEPLAAAGRYASMDATVYRRTGPAPAKVAPLPPAIDDAQDKAPVEERLRRLQKMLDEGLITPEDFERRKTVIIQDL